MIVQEAYPQITQITQMVKTKIMSFSCFMEVCVIRVICGLSLPFELYLCVADYLLAPRLPSIALTTFVG
jgi:hypothetical protein